MKDLLFNVDPLLSMLLVLLTCSALVGLGMLIVWALSEEDENGTQAKNAVSVPVNRGFKKKFEDRKKELVGRLTLQMTPVLVLDEISKMAETQIRQESLEKIKLLIDYSKFHVGLYSAIAVILITGINSKDSLISNSIQLTKWSIVTICLYTFAGLIGGLILSSVIHKTDIDEFKDNQLKLWKMNIGYYRFWLAAQYILFWSGTGIFMVALIATVWGLWGAKK